MALLTKKEFAEKCGIKTNTLSVYISRGKVTLTRGKIDDSKPQNIDFMSARLGRELAKKSPKTTKKRTTPSKKQTSTKRNAKESDGNVSKYELDKKKKSLDIQKIEREIRILNIKAEKLEGTLVPTDSVKALFAQHYKSVYVAFENAADNLIMEVEKKGNLSSKDTASLRTKLITIINKAIDEGITRSKKDIKNIVAEFSEVRGRGERK